MTNIDAYITFSGKCREAMSFYQECLGGELSMQTVEGTPMENQCPPAMKHHIMHAMLVKGDLMLMATDMVSRAGYHKGNNIALSLSCNSEEEINTFFTRLSVHGEVTEPLKHMFWGAIFGAVTDQFGINWILNFDKSKS